MVVSVDFEFLMNGVEPRKITVNNLVIAGWTGRDLAAMEAHISELEEIGVPRPSKTPTFYRCSVGQLTMDGEFQVIGKNSSGEIEFIILSLDDGYWVGLGSDHTDRVIESTDVTVSKQMCAKPIARSLWRFDDIRGHWDELILKSKITVGGEEEAYQEGPVTTMLDPEELISLYTKGPRLAVGTLMFCGTLAVSGGVRSSDVFSGNLIDPKLNRTISYSYKAINIPSEE